MWMMPPCARVFAAAASHIMPGPFRGYSKLSIKVLITSPSCALVPSLAPFGVIEFLSAFDIALHRSSPLMRCAAQSAEMSSQLMPHTFSV